MSPDRPVGTRVLDWIGESRRRWLVIGTLLCALQHGGFLTERFEALGKQVPTHTERLSRAVEIGEARLQRVDVMRFDVQIRA